VAIRRTFVIISLLHLFVLYNNLLPFQLIIDNFLKAVIRRVFSLTELEDSESLNSPAKLVQPACWLRKDYQEKAAGYILPVRHFPDRSGQPPFCEGFHEKDRNTGCIGGRGIDQMTEPVTRMTGMSGRTALNSRASSIPVIPGIVWSVTTKKDSQGVECHTLEIGKSRQIAVVRLSPEKVYIHREELERSIGESEK
jgi:hypothetical protein